MHPPRVQWLLWLLARKFLPLDAIASCPEIDPAASSGWMVKGVPHFSVRFRVPANHVPGTRTLVAWPGTTLGNIKVFQANQVSTGGAGGHSMMQTWAVGTNHPHLQFPMPVLQAQMSQKSLRLATP